MLLTFTAVFTATGEKNGRTWTRQDYKTADGRRYVHFTPSPTIPLHVAVDVEIEGENKIVGWKPVGSSLPEDHTQGYPQAIEASDARTAPPVASQTIPSGLSTRDTQIHRQTAAKVAAKLLDTFPEEEQTLETFYFVAEQLVDYFQNGARDTVPF